MRWMHLNCITTHNVPTTLQTDNRTEFENILMNQFWLERNIQHIVGSPYNPQHKGAAKTFKGQMKVFYTSLGSQKSWL